MDIQSRGNFRAFHVRHQFDVHLLQVLTRFYFGKRIIHLGSKPFSLEFSIRFGIFISIWNFRSKLKFYRGLRWIRFFFTCIFDLFIFD